MKKNKRKSILACAVLASVLGIGVCLPNSVEAATKWYWSGSNWKTSSSDASATGGTIQTKSKKLPTYAANDTFYVGYADSDIVSGNSIIFNSNTTYSLNFTLYGGYCDGNGTVGGTDANAGNSVTISAGTFSEPVVVFYGGCSRKGSAIGNTVTINGGVVGGKTYAGGTMYSPIEIYGGLVGSYHENVDCGQVKNNKVEISNGTINFSQANIYGGWSWGFGNDGGTDYNTVTISGGNFDGDSSAISICGGLSEKGSATGNTVTISGGTFSTPSNENINIYGGWSKGSGEIKNNTVEIGKGNFNNGAIKIYGGYSNSGAATGNIVTISGGTFKNKNATTYIRGGGSSGSGSIIDNSVKISNASFTGLTYIYGGHSYEGNGDVKNNQVAITNGSFARTSIYGGYSYTGLATGNTATIGDASFTGLTYIYGGDSYSSSATGNTVTITGGTFNGSTNTCIYGGYSSSSGDVSNNAVIISGGTFSDYTFIYGGYSYSGSVTNNTLKLATSLTANTVANFDKMVFTVPTNTNGAITMIKIATGGTAVSIAGVAVDVYLNGYEGDTIILIDKVVTGTLGTTNVYTGTEMATGTPTSNNAYKITLEDNQLLLKQLESTWYRVGTTEKKFEGSADVQNIPKTGETIDGDVTILKGAKEKAAVGSNPAIALNQYGFIDVGEYKLTIALTTKTKEMTANGNISAGSVVIDSGNTLKVNSGKTLTATSGVSNSGTLTIGASDLQSKVNNGTTGTTGTVNLSAGTLASGKTITGGTLNITGDVTANAGDIAGNTNTVAVNKTLTLNDGTLGKKITNSGTVKLDGAALGGAYVTAGTLEFAKDIEIYANYVAATSNKVDSDVTLILRTGTLGNAIANNGTVTLAGVESLTAAVSGGTLNIDQDLTTSAANIAGNTNTVVTGKTLTLNAGALGGHLSGDGAVVVSGTVSSAKNIANGVTNNGTFTVTGGSVTGGISNISGGTLNVSGGIISTGAVINAGVMNVSGGTVNTVTNTGTMTNNNTGTISGLVTNEGTFTTTANGIKGGVTNTSSLELTGGDLGCDITDAEIATGTTTVSGTVTNTNGKTITQANLTIAATTGNLTTDVDKLVIGSGTITNSGILILTGDGKDIDGNTDKAVDTLQKTVSGTGTTVFGDGTGTMTITANSSVATAMTVQDRTTLVIGADNVDGAVTNGGIINLGEGTLAKDITGTSGSRLNVTGDVTTQANNIKGTATLTVSADKTLTLTGGSSGAFDSLVSTVALGSTGTLQNTGFLDVLTNLNCAVDNDGTLTVAADKVLEDIDNSGVVNLEAGTLGNGYTITGGTLNIVEDVTAANAADIAGGTNVISDGKTLILNSGTLGGDLSGAGSVNINGAVTNTNNKSIAQKGLTISETTGGLTTEVDKLAISSGTITNNGILTLTADGNSPDTLEEEVTGSGTLVVDGAITATNDITQNALTINADRSLTMSAAGKKLTVTNAIDNSGALTIGASDLLSDVANGENADVTLNGGTLGNGYTITGGSITIGGDVTAQVTDLKSDKGITNAGSTLTITSEGALHDNISGEGTTVIDGTITSAKIIASAVTINSGKQLTNTGTISGGVTNNGALINTDTGTISGAVVSGGTFTTTANGITNGVKNTGSLELTGGDLGCSITDNETPTSTTTISGAVTNTSGMTITQSGLTIANGGSLTTDIGKLTIKNGDNYVTITNNGGLILSGNTILNDIDGSGTLKVDGNLSSAKTINNDVIINSGRQLTNSGTLKKTVKVSGILDNTGTLDDVVTVVTGGTVKTSAEKFVRSVVNNGNVELNGGTLGVDITGSGTTKLTGDVDLTHGKSIAGTLDGNGQKVTLVSNTAKSIDTFNVGTLTGNLSVGLDVDMTAFTSDKLAVGTLASGAVVTVDSINVVKNITPDPLELSKEEDNKITYLTATTNNGTTVVKNGTITIVHDTTHDYKYTFSAGTNAGMLKYKVEVTELTFKGFMEGTLNDYTNDPATLSLTVDMANRGDGSTVIVVGDNQENSEINVNLNGHNLTSADESTITINSGKTVNLNGGSAATAGTVDDKTNFSVLGTMNVSGNISLGGDITNIGTVTFVGTTTATGTLGGAGGYTNSGDLTVADGAKLQMTGEEGLANNGILNLGNATESALGANIAGTGTTNVNGKVSSAKSIANNLVVTAAGELTNTGIISGPVENNNVFNVGGGSVSGQVTNKKTMTISGGTVEGGIENAAAGTVTVSGGEVKAGAVINNGIFGVNAGNVSSAVTNNKTMTLEGTGTISGAVTITDSENAVYTVTAGIQSGIVTNKNVFNVNGGSVTGKVTNQKTMAVTSGEVSGGIDNTVEGTVTISGGEIKTNAVNNAGTLNVNEGAISSNITNGATLNISGGTVATVTNTGTMNVMDVSALTDDITNTNGIVNFDEAGAVLIDGVTITGGAINVKQNLTATVTDLASASGINNKATLTLTGTGDILDNIDNLDGVAGTTVISGTITNKGNKSITQGYLTIAGSLNTEVDKLHIGPNDMGTITNNGTLTLTADGNSPDTLEETVTGSGILNFEGSKKITATGTITQTTVNVDTDLDMDNTLTAGSLFVASGKKLTVDSGKQLTVTNAINNSGTLIIGASDLLSNVANDENANVTLNEGTLGNGYTITSGSITIGGDVTAQVTDLLSDKGITNAGSTLTIEGEGALHDNISGEGTTVIDGAITSAKTIANKLMINSGKQLTNTGTISGAVTNEGIFAVTGGSVTGAVTNNLTMNVSGGEVIGKVANNGNFGVSGGMIVLVDNKGTMTVTNLASLSGAITNDADGIVNLNADGTLATGSTISGGTLNINVNITANATDIAGASNVMATGKNLNLTGGTLGGPVTGAGSFNVTSGTVTADADRIGTTGTNTITGTLNLVGAVGEGNILANALTGTGKTVVTGGVESAVLTVIAKAEISTSGGIEVEPYNRLVMGGGNVKVNVKVDEDAEIVLKGGTVTDYTINGNNSTLANPIGTLSLTEGAKMVVGTDSKEAKGVDNISIGTVNVGGKDADGNSSQLYIAKGIAADKVKIGTLNISDNGQIILDPELLMKTIYNKGKLEFGAKTTDNIGSVDVTGTGVINVRLPDNTIYTLNELEKVRKAWFGEDFADVPYLKFAGENVKAVFDEALLQAGKENLVVNAPTESKGDGNLTATIEGKQLKMASDIIVQHGVPVEEADNRYVLILDNKGKTLNDAFQKVTDIELKNSEIIGAKGIKVHENANKAVHIKMSGSSKMSLIGADGLVLGMDANRHDMAEQKTDLTFTPSVDGEGKPIVPVLELTGKSKVVVNSIHGNGWIYVDPSYLQVDDGSGEFNAKICSITDGSITNIGNIVEGSTTVYTIEALKDIVLYEDLNLNATLADLDTTNEGKLCYNENTGKKLGLMALKGHVSLGETGCIAATSDEDKENIGNEKVYLNGEGALLAVDSSIAFNDGDCVDDVAIFKAANENYVPNVAITGVNGEDAVKIDWNNAKLFLTGIEEKGVGIYAIMQGTGIDGTQYFDIENDMVQQDGGDTYRIVELDEQEQLDLNNYLGVTSDQKIYAVRVDWNKVEKIFTEGPVNGQEAWNNMLQNDDKHTPGKEWLLKVIKGTKQDRETGRSALNQVASLAQNLGVERGAYDVTNMVGNAIGEHLQNRNMGERVWASFTHSKDKVDGLNLYGMNTQYDAQHNGTSVGYDLVDDQDITLGVALHYADGNTTNGFGGHNDSTHTGISVYGQKQLGKFVVQGDVNYLHGSNELKQDVYGTEMSGKAKTDTVSVGFGVRRPVKAGKGFVTPFAGVKYMHINSKKFSDNLGIGHGAEKINSVVVPVGLEYNGKFKVQGSNWTWKPKLAAGYMFNLGNRDNNMVMDYRGVADSFCYEFVDKGAFFTNVGMVFEKKNVTIGVGYDYMKSKNSRNSRWNVSVNFSF